MTPAQLETMMLVAIMEAGFSQRACSIYDGRRWVTYWPSRGVVEFH